MRHPEIPPYVHHHCGEAWLIVPRWDAGGQLATLRIPLEAEGLTRLAQQSAAAAQQLLYAARRAAEAERIGPVRQPGPG